MRNTSVRRVAFRPPAPRRSPLRPGFSLIEAMVALTILAIAGSALLLGVDSSLQMTTFSLEQTVATSMAEQLIDEVLGARYCEYGLSPYDIVLQPGAAEAATGTRELFDDIDDYNGVDDQPPVDFYGVALGTDDGEGGQRPAALRAPEGFFDHWREQVEVYYVDAADLASRLPSGQVSDYRAVEVRIYYQDPELGARELVKLRRVVAYVPPM